MSLQPSFAVTLGGGGDPRPLDRSQTFDFAASPANNTATYVATQADGKLKGIKRVAITNMCVQFVNSKSASGNSVAGTRSYTRSAEGGIPGGLGEAKMQAVADDWLAQYDQGIRVGERSDGAYASSSKGFTSESVVYVSPKGRPFAIDCGTISPVSTSTFVRMSYPMAETVHRPTERSVHGAPQVKGRIQGILG
jgi:hypothetical protein